MSNIVLNTSDSSSNKSDGESVTVSLHIDRQKPTSVNPEQLFFDLFTSVSCPRPVRWVEMAYQKRDEWLSVVNVELRVSYSSGRYVRHDGLDQPAPTGTRTKLGFVLIMTTPSYIEVDPPHFLVGGARSLPKLKLSVRQTPRYLALTLKPAVNMGLPLALGFVNVTSIHRVGSSLVGSTDGSWTRRIGADFDARSPYTPRLWNRGWPYNPCAGVRRVSPRDLTW